MSGMEALGRLLNVIPIGAGKAHKVRGASGILYVCTGTDTFTVQSSSSFGGTYAPLACIKNVYSATATDGTAAWAKNALAGYNTGVTPLSAVTIGGGTPTVAGAAMLAFHVFTSELSDPGDYLKVTVGNTGLVQVIPYDLVVQRGPANLEILGS